MGRGDFQVWQRRLWHGAEFRKLSASARGVVLMLTHLTPDSTGIIGGKRRPLSSTEIAKEVEIAHATVLTALVRGVGEGLLIQDGRSFAFSKPFSGNCKNAISEIESPAVTAQGVTTPVLHPSHDHSPSLLPQTPTSQPLDEVVSESSKESSKEDSKDATVVPIQEEIPETLEGKLIFIIERMPRLKDITKDPAKTAAKLVECYLGEFDEKWMLDTAKAEREWCFAREGKPVLTGKVDGNKTIQNWFRMKAEDTRKGRKKLAGQELGRKARPVEDLDKYLHLENGG